MDGPLCEMKFVPIASNNDMNRFRRVLDVGFGLGTNAPYFSAAHYLGIDLHVQFICEWDFVRVHCRHRALSGDGRE